jgi:hypothetical protein
VEKEWVGREKVGLVQGMGALRIKEGGIRVSKWINHEPAPESVCVSTVSHQSYLSSCTSSL